MLLKNRANPDSKQASKFPLRLILVVPFVLDRQQSREAGCNDFLPKPVQAEELLEQLQSYLGLEWIYETKQELIPQTCPR